MPDDHLPHLPDLKNFTLESSLLLLDRYISDNGPKVGKASTDFGHAASDDLPEDWDAESPMSDHAMATKTKRYRAEVFMGEVVGAFDALKLSGKHQHAYLTRIIDDPAMPDCVVDVAIREQDRVIESTPSLKKDRDALDDEFGHLINDRAPHP